MELIYKASRKISGLKISDKLLFAAFIFYNLIVIVLSFFHEPWFDEAQAWQIARTASVYDIFFTIPHYEGHPPLWHLLLLPFAKLGAPYEFSLSLVNIVFMVITVWLLMFKSSMPKILKLTVPFTYFLCYQYAIVCRPYSIMLLGFVLCGIFYNSKNEKPMPMVLSLMLLCASSAYGLAYAFFICIAWLTELWNKQNFIGFVKSVVTSKAFKWLLLLAVFAVCILLLIIPGENSPLHSEALALEDIKQYINNLLYTVFLLPYDSTIGSITVGDINIFSINFLNPKYIPYAIISIGIYALLFAYTKKSKKLPLLIPIVFMPFIFAAVFFWSHHTGIFIMYLIFLSCICSDQNPSQTEGNDTAVILFNCCWYLIVIIQIIWTAMSYGLEFRYSYCCGRELGEYINSNDLTDAYIMPSGDLTSKYYDFDLSAYATIVLPYMDENIFPTFRSGNEQDAFFPHAKKDVEEISQIIETIKALGPPDYIIGYCSANANDQNWGEESDKQPQGWLKKEDNVKLSSDYFDFIYKDNKYTITAEFNDGMIYKGHYINSYNAIFERQTEDE